MAILILLLIVLLVLGGERIAALGRGFGEGAKAFKRAVRRPGPALEARSRDVIVVSAEPLSDEPVPKARRNSDDRSEGF